MLRSRGRYVAVALPVVVTLSWIPAFGGRATAAVVASQSSKATCKQLTNAQIQPLLATPITKVKVTAALSTGQQCVYSGSGDEGSGEDIDVLVIKGTAATQGFKEEVKGLGSKVAVPGVGDKAYRAKGDYQIDSIKGSEFCSVSVGDEESVPGVNALLVNGTSDIPESANAIVASALGTICNRIYGKGNTKPALSGLSSVTPIS
jgi:hypothetical protein